MSFELTFYDVLEQSLPEHEREHKTLMGAKDEAYRVLGLLEDRGAHPAIIYEGDEQIAVIR